MNSIALAVGVIVLSTLSGCHAAQIDGTRVLKVADGDTFEVDQGRVRLFGIDAPEFDQPHGRESTRALRSLIEGKVVKIDVVATDDYGRWVAKVRYGEMDVNGEMIRRGHAWVYRRYSRDSRWLALERAAQDTQAGLWGKPSATAPWEWRERGGARTDRACRIKGNINDRGTKIYHLPGSAAYARTKISPRRGERWFCSTAEARAAGWRPVRNPTNANAS